jgi:predicted membrane protein
MCVDSDVQSSYMVTSYLEYYVTCCLCGSSSTCRAMCVASRATRLFLGIILAIALRLLYYHIKIIICFTRTTYSLHRQIKFQDISCSRFLLHPLTTTEWKFCPTQFIGNSPIGKSCFYFSSEHQALFALGKRTAETSHTMLRSVYWN